MNYGYFSKDSSEFIITKPDTPKSWLNYLTNGSYTAVVSQCGDGFSFIKDVHSNKILSWDADDQSAGKHGRYLYVRDKLSKQVFCPTYQPLCAEMSTYKAHHGIGYSTIESSFAQIDAEITYFVPLHEQCEVWVIKLTNHSSKTKSLQLFPLCGFEFNTVTSAYNRVWYNKRVQSINAAKPFSNKVIFCHSSLPIKGYATSKKSFLGSNNSFEHPKLVCSGSWVNTPLTVGEPGIGAFFHEISLPGKKSKTFTVIVGQVEKTQEIPKIIKKYRSIPQTLKELNFSKQYWKDKIEQNIHIETPDNDFNVMTNVWLKYQTRINNIIPRSAYYPPGESLDHEYRSACQNAEAVMALDAGTSLRGRIFKIAGLIRADGTTAPGWSETLGPSSQLPKKYDTLWLTSTVSSYIKETGDSGILKEKAPYLKDKYIKGWTIDQEFSGKPLVEGEGTLYEHLWKNLEFTFNDIDESGLPRLGRGDCNSSMNQAGSNHKGGSVWIAQALVRSLKILARLSDLINEREKASELRRRATSMTERIEQFWDGEWYQRAISDDGVIYGTNKNKEGKIYAMVQSWAVISGIAQSEKLQKIFKSIDKHLIDSSGISLLSPAYTEHDLKLGIITLLPPGMRDNGSVALYAAAWMILAYCCAGKGDKAFELLKKIMPCAQKDIETYTCEPYVFAGYINGPDHPYAPGEGSHSWIDPSAGVIFHTVLEWMAGIRPELNGLLIDPCMPSHWKKIRITRAFRGNLYDISIENPHGVEKKIKEMLVNNEKIHGNLIVSREKNKKITVKVIMGSAASKRAKKEKALAAI
ncbi:MAG: hypothetical protein ABIA63_14585 [bacterium]